VACAATLHRQGATIRDAGDAARALEPLAGAAASALFGTGLVAAALLAAFLLLMGRDREVMGRYASGRGATAAQAVALVLVAACALSLLLHVLS